MSKHFLNNGSQLKNPDISGAIFTLSFSILIQGSLVDPDYARVFFVSRVEKYQKIDHGRKCQKKDKQNVRKFRKWVEKYRNDWEWLLINYDELWWFQTFPCLMACSSRIATCDGLLYILTISSTKTRFLAAVEFWFGPCAWKKSKLCYEVNF